MSATTTTQSNDLLSDEFTLGSKVIGYVLQALAWGIAAAIAWSCSSLVMGIVMFIIMFIVMSLLTALLHLVLLFKLPTTTVEGIGSFTGKAASRVTGMFTRKAAA